MRISLGSFPLKKLANPYQSALVPAGKEVKVYSLKLPENVVCFIYDVAVSNYLEWKWIIDGEEVNIKFDSKRFHFDPPFLVKNYTEFYTKNPTNFDLIASVYCDGICHKEYVFEKEVVIKEDSEKILKSLNEIKSHLESLVPKGEVFDRKVEVTDTVKMIYDPKGNGLNWTACDIINAGPAPVYIAVNAWKRPETPLAPGLTTNINLGKRGTIKKLYLVCDKGKRATVLLKVLK